MLVDFDFDQFAKTHKALKDSKLSDLGEELARLQRKLLDTDKNLIIMIDGWESSQKGYLMKKIVQELDPRYFEVAVFNDFGRIENQQPYLSKFFMETPKKGRISVFDSSFYYPVFNDFKIKDKDLAHYIKDFASAERALADDGTLFIKFFTNQTEKTMKKRIQELMNHEDREILVSEKDHYQLKNYSAFQTHFDKVLGLSSQDELADWHILSVEDRKIAAAFAIQTIIDELSAFIDQEVDTTVPTNAVVVKEEIDIRNLDLTVALSEEEYDKLLEPLQEEAGELIYRLYKEGKSAIIAFEGSDAAGKGGAIKRLTKLMDPRSVDVATVASPTQEELTHHYLWRFYRDFPTKGKMTVFDRTWYGRVLVERIEKITPEYRWRQAYNEINEMEHNLVHHDDLMITKFLLLIDSDEQAKRFKEREEDPDKTYKITEEDWRNRAKFDDYVLAFNDMLNYTNTEEAPWYVVPAINKYYARIFVLKTFIERMKAFLAK